MILVNTVPNPINVAPKLQKLQSRKVPIIGGHRQQLRHQSGKTYSLVEMKFRRDKNHNQTSEASQNKYSYENASFIH